MSQSDFENLKQDVAQAATDTKEQTKGAFEQAAADTKEQTKGAFKQAAVDTKEQTKAAFEETRQQTGDFNQKVAQKFKDGETKAKAGAEEFSDKFTAKANEYAGKTENAVEGLADKADEVFKKGTTAVKEFWDEKTHKQ